MLDKPRSLENDIAIAFDSVSYAYQNGELALDSITFEIRRGEAVSIIGKNGSGKSTLASLIDALLKPCNGSISICGINANDADAKALIRQKVGYIFQDPLDSIVSSIVKDEVSFGPCNLGLSIEEVDERVNDALHALDIEDLADADVNTLSGGQLQRVAIASVLSIDPDILIFDEASSMLDAESATELLHLIEKLISSGKTVILLTHNTAEVALTKRTLWLNGGKLIYDGILQDDIISKALPPIPNKKELDALFPITDTSKDTKRGIPLISVENVGFAYPNANEPTLDSLSFEVYSSEVIAIMGNNGSGKSTLLKLMNGTLMPTEGNISICGIVTETKEGRNTARSHVGLCFQYPERQLFAQSVYDDVAFGPKAQKMSDIDKIVNNALEAVGLNPETFAQRSPFKLSGGEQRRCAIAGVLALNPSILAFDEPCAGLDAEGRISLIKLIYKLRSLGKTIIFVTHDIDEANLLADRIIRIDRDPS